MTFTTRHATARRAPSNHDGSGQMTSSLKQLGLSLFTMIALSGLTVSASAEASYFRSNENHVIVDVEPLTRQEFYGPNKIQFHCEAINGTATAEEAATPEITLTPEPSSCIGTILGTQFDAHVEPNGCHYTFTVTEEAESPSHELGSGEYFSGPVHIKCPEESEIKVKLTYLGFKLECIRIPPQTPTEPTVDFTVETEGETPVGIKLVSTVKGIKEIAVSNCSPTGEPQEYHETEYRGEVTTTGTDTEENTVDLWIE